MARICPETGDVVLYLTCIECEDKICEKVNDTSEHDDKDKNDGERDYE